MYLSSLSEEQKKAFLAIAMRIIKADGVMDPKERKTIEVMRYEMGLLEETDLPKGYIEDFLKPFDTRESKVIALIESIALAYVDGDYAEEEKKILREMALTFEFSEKEATDMENWVLRYRELQKEALAMFSE
jgi:tellurite resistance protein